MRQAGGLVRTTPINLAELPVEIAGVGLALGVLDSLEDGEGLLSEGRNKIAAEERKLAEVVRQESELVNLRLQELVSQEALEQSAALLRARRT